jgi:hypothetical protein
MLTEKIGDARAVDLFVVMLGAGCEKENGKRRTMIRRQSAFWPTKSGFKP